MNNEQKTYHFSHWNNVLNSENEKKHPFFLNKKKTVKNFQNQNSRTREETNKYYDFNVVVYPFLFLLMDDDDHHNCLTYLLDDVIMIIMS